MALLFAWPISPLERPSVLGSVETHVPTRHLLFTRGDDTLRWLQAQGVTLRARGAGTLHPEELPLPR
ncbi:MAG: hypothetical protein H6740_02620 [Alphaproteobacteria bacterium]|nr:hypothetical protein [Alphaproteobacteria bacterium]